MSRKTVNTLMRATAFAGAAAFALSGCGAADKAGETNTEGKPIINVLVIKHTLTKPMAEMKWPKQLESACDCEIKWQEVAADWDQKKQAILASEDVPDLSIAAFTDTDMATYSSLFEDLSDDLDSMPNVKKLFEEEPAAKKLAENSDGQIFTLPTSKSAIKDTTLPKSSERMYINKAWLDKLGLDIPTTWDELENVLKAFKTQDPNGNGKQDEVPMDFQSPSTSGFGYFQPTMLLGSTGLPLSDSDTYATGIFVEDSTVKNFLIDDRYKEVIKFLSRLWSEGLISSDAFTHDFTQSQALTHGDGKTAKVGFSWAWSNADRFGLDLADQYVSMPQMKATADQTATPKWSAASEGRIYMANKAAVSAATPYKEQVFKILNKFYDPDISIQAYKGDFDVDTKKNGDLNYEVLMPTDSSKELGTWSWIETLVDNAPIWLQGKIDEPEAEHLAKQEDAALEEAYANQDQDTEKWPFGVKMNSDDLSTISLNNSTIMNTAMTQFSQWVTKGGVDEGWDQYVKTLKDAKIDDNIAIYQKYYDAAQ